jgi:peptide deformylase
MEVVVPDEFKYLYVRNAERPVYKIPAPVLRSNAAPVTKISKKTQLLIDEMLRVMKTANGIGLAAPQMGVLQNVIVVAPQGMKPTAFVNPVVVKSEGEIVGQEGCLSLPGLYGDVKRAEYIVLQALDRKGRAYEYELEGMPARVVLHEIDHLTGVLFIDKVDPASLHWTHPDGTPDEI